MDMPNSNFVCVNKCLWNTLLIDHINMRTLLENNKRVIERRQASQARYYLKNKARLSSRSRDYYQNVVKAKRLEGADEAVEVDWQRVQEALEMSIE